MQPLQNAQLSAEGAPSAVITAAFASGEPQLDEDDAARPEAYATDHHWDKQRREPWQLHSEQGPNIDCRGRAATQVAETDVIVNPLEHAYSSTTWTDMDLDSWRRAWELLRTLDEAQLPEPESRDWQSLG
ncbi:MAG: hypothetical protein ACKPKO_32735, partial [Candidatus Fonsibacter sp.]